MVELCIPLMESETMFAATTGKLTYGRKSKKVDDNCKTGTYNFLKHFD